MAGWFVLDGEVASTLSWAQSNSVGALSDRPCRVMMMMIAIWRDRSPICAPVSRVSWGGYWQITNGEPWRTWSHPNTSNNSTTSPCQHQHLWCHLQNHLHKYFHGSLLKAFQGVNTLSCKFKWYSAKFLNLKSCVTRTIFLCNQKTRPNTLHLQKINKEGRRDQSRGTS